MAKGIIAVIAALILCIVGGMVLVAVGKFLLGVAFVIGMLAIAGLVIALAIAAKIGKGIF